MKNIKLILFLFGIILFAAISCEKVILQNNLNFVLPVNGDKTTIDTIINQIEFKFCLLNNGGEPSISLNEGDSFSFYLSLTNHGNLDSVLCLDNSFLYHPEDGFCKVYNSRDSLIGVPFIVPPTVYKVGSGAFPFYGDNIKYELKVPWRDDRDEWNTLACFFVSTHQSLLPKGKYYTRLVHRFQFDKKHWQPSLYTDTLNFKINFIIK